MSPLQINHKIALLKGNSFPQTFVSRGDYLHCSPLLHRACEEIKVDIGNIQGLQDQTWEAEIKAKEALLEFYNEYCKAAPFCTNTVNDDEDDDLTEVSIELARRADALSQAIAQSKERLRNVPGVALAGVENAIEELWNSMEKLCDEIRQPVRRGCLLVVGRTGAAKSSLINAIAQQEVCEVTHHTPGTGMPIAYKTKHMVLIDSRGFGYLLPASNFYC